MIKRLLLAALLGVIALPAGAAMNIQQRGDGTASWIGRTTGTFSNCVGGVNLSVPGVILSQTSTHYAPVTITNAVIKSIWGTAQSTSAGTAKVRVYVNQTSNALGFRNSSGSLLTEAVLTFSTASAGTTSRISTIGEVSGATSMISNVTQEGHYIAVSSDGGGTSSLASANVLIRVCPR